MLSSIFGTRKVNPDLSFLGVDMHSHLLPGLDDGLAELSETINFIKELHALGYHKLICTPHILFELYPNSPETILPKLELVRNELKEQGIPMQLEVAAEYMVDMEMQQYVDAGKPLLTFGKNLVLIEMSYIAASKNIEQVIFNLRMKGIQPVLAHPERYNYYHYDFEKYERFRDLGCLLQVNLLSLLGYYGKPVKQVAEKLISKEMVDLLGTDMHNQKHLDALKDLASQKSFYTFLNKYAFKNKTLL